MSRALERLRQMFGDPLVVRSGRAYQRTVRGERVLRELETLMPRLEAMVRGAEFDPAQSQERFRVALTDHASAILLPSLVARVRSTAPGVEVQVSAWRIEAYEDVGTGRIDTALSAEEAPPELETEVLFNMEFVCVVGAAQRVRTRRLTMKQYLQLPHALVKTLEGQQTPVDRTLAQLGTKRQVALSLPFFLPALFAIAHTDLILTVPRKLARVVSNITGVRLLEPPREIKVFPYFMVWHPRLTNERAHAWFREQLRGAAQTS